MVFVIVHTPWPISKGLDHLFCKSMIVSMLYACLSLSCSRLCHAWHLSRFVVVWLYLTPIRPWLVVTTWEALPWCQLLRAYLSSFPLHVTIFLPCLFVPHVGFLCIFSCLLICSCMSLACQCVIYASTQWSYGHSIQTYICTLRTPPFVCFLTCLLSRLFACFLISLLAMSIMSIMLICFMPLSYAICMFSFHCLFAGFLSLPLHVHTWSEDA